MCIKTAGGLVGEGSCNQREINSAHNKIRHLTANIEKELISCTPNAEAYDYKKALANLKKSSQDWKSLLQRDCKLTANLVGLGTGSTGAYQHCQLDHLRLRVLALSNRLRSIELTRVPLTESNATGNSPNSFISCNHQYAFHQPLLTAAIIQSKEIPMPCCSKFKITFAFLAAFGGLALTGCATAPGTTFTELKTAAADQASVYVYRRDRFFAVGVSFKVEVDAKPVGDLYNASFLNLSLAPGKHSIVVKPGGMAKNFALDIQALRGKTHFVEFDLNGGPLANVFYIGSELLEQPEDKALTELKTLKSAK